MQKTPDFMPAYQAKLPRTDHVLSHDLTFTSCSGHLNPVFHTILSPGDTVKLGMEYEIRTMPLEAAAFEDFAVHVEYFFVPMQLLLQTFDTAYFGITDNFSSLFAGALPLNSLPVLDFTDIVTELASKRGMPAMVYPELAVPVESIGQSALRLFDLLGYCPIGISGATDSGNGVFYNPNVFPYPVLAYNCIYQNYYRLDARENFDQTTFNWDKFYSQSAAVDHTDYPITNFYMKYRPLDSDYFTDVKVSPLVDVLNLNRKNLLHPANQYLTRNKLGSTVNVLTSGSQGLPQPPLGTNTTDPSQFIQTQFGFRSYQSPNPLFNGSDISTANIRAMFASEKLWSITGRAKKTYDDQTLAHFGFKVPHDVKHNITCFGHDVNYIHVGEVISTASTTQAPLGEIAGKGYGRQTSKRHTFQAPCHGVVMTIFSIVPKRNYEAGILKHNNVASVWDLYVPEYDHLGMQPLYVFETEYLDQGNNIAADIVGWQYRYEQWKRRYNRVTGAFKNFTGTLKGWIPSYTPYNGNMYTMQKSGKHSNLPNTDSYTQFINLPLDTNQLFLGQVPNQWSTSFEGATEWAKIYDNDPFVVHSTIDCILVSTMSDYSLPRLDG